MYFLVCTLEKTISFGLKWHQEALIRVKEYSDKVSVGLVTCLCTDFPLFESGCALCMSVLFVHFTPAHFEKSKLIFQFCLRNTKSSQNRNERIEFLKIQNQIATYRIWIEDNVAVNLVSGELRAALPYFEKHHGGRRVDRFLPRGAEEHQRRHLLVQRHRPWVRQGVVEQNRPRKVTRIPATIFEWNGSLSWCKWRNHCTRVGCGCCWEL